MARKGRKLTFADAYVNPPANLNRPKRKNKKRKGKKKVVPRRLITDCQKLVNVVASRVLCSCSDTPPMIYDCNGARCLPTKFITRKNVSTDSSGNHVTEIRPSLFQQHRTATDITDNTVTTWGTFAPASGLDSVNFANYRVTSMCVRYIAVSSPNESQGLAMGVIQHRAIAFPETTNTLFEEYHSVSQFAADLCLCGAPNGQTGFDHVSIAEQADGWPVMYLMIRAGATSTQIGEIIIELAVEQLPAAQNQFNLYLKEGAPAIPQLEAAVDHARRVHAKITDNREDSKATEKSVWQASMEAVGMFVESLGPTFVQTVLTLV
jgi:hypothetical protein